MERGSVNLARWVEGEPIPLAELENQLYGYGALDIHGQPVVLFNGECHLETCAKALPKNLLRRARRSRPRDALGQ